MSKVTILVMVGAVFCVGCTTTLAEEVKEPVPVNANLKALNEYRPVRKVVAKYFPDATYLLFEDNFHFEDSTQLHVEEMISKIPKGETPQLEACRGPKQTGGVWCDIWLRKGKSPAYQRSEGATPRKHFVEYKIYQELHGIDCHLYVTLRVPKGDKSADFVRDFTALIRSYSHDFVTDE